MNVLHTEMQGYYSKCNLIQEKGEMGGGGRGGAKRYKFSEKVKYRLVLSDKHTLKAHKIKVGV